MQKVFVFIGVFFACFYASAYGASWQGLPDGICAKYAAQEFEKIAPQPGVNWLKYNYDWVLQARQAGWVVKTSVRDVIPGAIVEWQGTKRDGGHVAIVRRVLANRIIVEEMNVGTTTGMAVYNFGGESHQSPVTDGWNKISIRSILYSDLLKMDNKKFMGYIWPVRQSDYAQNPDKYTVSSVDQLKTKEPRYKSFKEYWAPTYMIKEFDKIAPAPGANWTGNVKEWIQNAQAAGWVTTLDCNEAQIGTITIQYNPVDKLVKVGLICAINRDLITIDLRKSDLSPFRETVTASNLQKPDKEGYQLLGCILPVRQNPSGLPTNSINK